MSLTQSTLASLCSLGPQYGANAKAIPLEEGASRYLRITDINENGSLNEDKVGADIEDTSPFLLKKGDLVFARSGNTVGKTYVHMSNENLVFAGYLIRFSPDTTKVLPKYLYYFTKSLTYNNWVSSKKRIGGQPNINGKEYSGLQIPLPSTLAEQHRVVEILDQADALRQQRREANQISQKLLPALFREVFGDPNTNPRNWPLLTLEEAFQDCSRHGRRIPKLEYLTEGKFPIVDQGQKEVIGYSNNEGDLYTGATPVILFGDHTRIFKFIDYPFCIGADGVRLLAPRILDPLFAFGLARLLDIPSKGYSRHFKVLRETKFINPPAPLQSNFASNLRQLKKIQQHAKTSTTTIETLFQTLLHRAFDGTLTAKWREAHAAELLQEMEIQNK